MVNIFSAKWKIFNGWSLLVNASISQPWHVSCPQFFKALALHNQNKYQLNGQYSQVDEIPTYTQKDHYCRGEGVGIKINCQITASIPQLCKTHAKLSYYFSNTKKLNLYTMYIYIYANTMQISAICIPYSTLLLLYGQLFSPKILTF